MSITSRIYDSARQRDGEELKRDGWRSGILAVSVTLTSLWFAGRVRPIATPISGTTNSGC